MVTASSKRRLGAILLALLPLTAAHGGTEVGSRPGPPLDFMTTVCPSCSLASAGLQKLFTEPGPKRFHPIGIGPNLALALTLQEYGWNHGLTFPFGTVPHAEVGAYLQHPANKLSLVPTLALIDRNGRIRLIEVGWKGGR
jgi:hypothetical protein